MPRARSPQNIGLPKRWRFTHGGYYYQVPPGEERNWDGKQTYLLGKTLAAAYKHWAEKLEEFGEFEKSELIGELLDRYAAEVIPTKAVSTHERDFRSVAQLKKTFATTKINQFKPSDVYKYNRLRGKKVYKGKGKVVGGPSASKHEITLLSHAFTKAVEWDYIKRHPFKGEVQLEGSKPRTRYVEDWEIVECLSLESRRKKGSVSVIQPYIRIKLLTGLSQSDMLRLNPARQFKDDGIHIQRHKTAEDVGKRTIYEWTPELRAAVQDAMMYRPVHISPFLFCNNRGEGYIDETTGKPSGWNSMWQRFMRRVLKETKVEERFTEHDLRAKCASDANSLEHARALLSHIDSRTTNKIYRRKPERVTPVR
jgi:hypothetical protein